MGTRLALPCCKRRKTGRGLGTRLRDNLSSCMNSTPWSIFCLGFLSLRSFAASAARCALSRSVDRSVSSPLFASSFGFASHFETRWCYIDDPRSFTQEQDGFIMISTTPNTRAFSNFTQREYCYSTYDVRIHTNNIPVHKTPLAFNTLMWGLVQARPITLFWNFTVKKKCNTNLRCSISKIEKNKQTNKKQNVQI